MFTSKRAKTESDTVEIAQLIPAYEVEVTKNMINLIEMLNHNINIHFSYYDKSMVGHIADCIKFPNGNYYAVEGKPFFEKTINDEDHSSLAIHRVQNIDTHEWFQLKIYTLNDNQQLTNKIKNEVSTLVNLKQFHQTIDDSQFNKKYYILKDYVEGIDLNKYIINKQISFAIKLQIAISILDQLSILHTQDRYLHCDIKAGNIIINPLTLEIKLIDFDLSIKSESDSDLSAQSDILIGTLGYLAPELVSSIPHTYNEKSEMYAYGKVLDELFDINMPTGSSLTLFNQSDKLTKDELDALSIINDLTDKNPEKRLSLNEAHKRLKSLTNQLEEKKHPQIALSQ